MRLNKHISDAGYCSRREADGLIGEGRVTVNGVRAHIAAEVGEGDKVRIDDKPLAARTAAKGQRRHIYIALNKPVGVTSTLNPRSRTTSSSALATSSAFFRSAAWTKNRKA
jgi:23S rRNA pseudouridine2604 synthase